MGHLLYLPKEQLDSRTRSLDDFLEACELRDVERVGISIRQGIPSTLDRFTRMPFLIRYSGHNAAGRMVVARSQEDVDCLLFEKSDREFRRPLWGISDRYPAHISLIEYGKACTRYCAGRGRFPTKLHVAYPRDYTWHLRPADISVVPERIPAFAFL